MHIKEYLLQRQISNMKYTRRRVINKSVRVDVFVPIRPIYSQLSVLFENHSAFALYMCK